MPTNNSQREFALQVVKQLRDAGHEALWAGGCVRDELLGRDPQDYDVATSARPEQVRQLFGKRRTLAVGAAFGVIVVLGSKEQQPIEVATFRSDGAYVDGRHPTEVTFTTAEEDAQRRDFTINGLFYDPLAEKLIDYVGGEQDLRAGIIRAIGDPTARFTEDKLRMIRAVRFATTFGFAMEPATQTAIQCMSAEIRVVSAERIGGELRKILLHANRSVGITQLHEIGLLNHLIRYFPLEDQASNEDATRFAQTLTVLSRLESPSLPLALAALLIEIQNSTAASQVGRELRYTNKEIERTAWLLAKRGLIKNAHVSPWCTIQRHLVHPGAQELIALHEATVGAEDASSAFCKAKLQLPAIELNPEPLLLGTDLIAHGLQPGPHFATLLDFVRDAQLEEKITTRQQALQLVDQWLTENPTN